MKAGDRLFRDLIASFLVLAVADGAIKGVTTKEQLQKISPRRGDKSFQQQWNKDKASMTDLSLGDPYVRRLSFLIVRRAPRSGKRTGRRREPFLLPYRSMYSFTFSKIG